MNLIFYLVYIILGMLFDFAGAGLLAYIWNEDIKDGDNYIYYGSAITYVLALLFYIAGVVILCIAQGGISDALKQVARIVFYILGSLIAASDLTFSTLFCQRMKIVFTDNKLVFYYLLVWMCVAVCRVILSTLFSLLAGRDLTSRKLQYMPLQYPTQWMTQYEAQSQATLSLPYYTSY